MNPEIILASQSLYRKKILRQFGIPFQAHSHLVDERALEELFDGSPLELSGYLALKKAESLKTLFPDRIIVGSDQVLIFNNQSMVKPKSEEEIIKRLELLQGKTHFLSTSVAVLPGNSEESYQKTILSEMTMDSFSDKEIVFFAQQEGVLDSVGGYFFEKQGALLFKEVKTTDPYSIIGLPVLSLVGWLRRSGNFRFHTSPK